MLAVALLGLLVAAGAQAAGPAPRSTSAPHCREGFRIVSTVIRRDGKARVLRACRRKVTKSRPTGAPPSAPVAPASSDPTAPASAPLAATSLIAPVAPTVPPAEPTTPPVRTTPPVVSTASPEVQAAIGLGFAQNPLVPDEVTWHYSAAASTTVTVNGVAQTEKVPLPAGVLAFFVDGRLDCEINVGGAIAASACTVDLQQLGPHEVETIYSAGALSSVATRTDYIGKYPTQTNLQVSVEPVAPEYLEIGPNAYGYIQFGFEVARLRINAATTPGGYPIFDCEGQPAGCLEPEIPGLAAHHGSVSVPLFAQHRLNSVTGREEWHVAFDADNPALRESGDFWQFPEESVGAQFFHAVSDPDPASYETSAITVPLNLNGGHYPFYRWMRNPAESGGSIAAVEGTARKVLTIGTYEKFDGPEEWLKVASQFFGETGEAEGCIYRLRINGRDMNEDRRSSTQAWGFYNGWGGLAAGPQAFEIWVERAAGAGPGNCRISSGYFEAYEVVH